MLTPPILLIIFNRPETTRQVFRAIRQQHPQRLYIAADGPRPNHPTDAENCRQARDIIHQIDWPCHPKILFHDQNLGCRTAVSTAISWFFEHVEQGIILEDDCLPHPTFFPYCEELLNKYRHDTRIGHISGNSFLPHALDHAYSYNFSAIAHIWGWATWRRVWQHYDPRLPYWHEAQHDANKRRSLFRTLREEIYFTTFIPDALNNNNGLNTWDVQYLYMLRLQHQLSIYPTVNLVTNLGLTAPEVTHASSRTAAKYRRPLQPISFPLRHPPYLLPNRLLDDLTCRKYFFSLQRVARYFLGGGMRNRRNI
jgi:hypothetical protein